MLVLIAAFATFLLYKNFTNNLANADSADQSELALLGMLIDKALKQARFEDVAATLNTWGNRQPDVNEIRVTAANGFQLGQYLRPHPAEHKQDLSTTLEYGYHESATLYLSKDRDLIYSSRDTLAIEILAGLAVLSVLILSLAYLSIRRHEATLALSELTDQLEQRVRERTADLEAANRDLREFSYSVAHDLRTPLRALHSFSDLLAQDYSERLDAQGLNYVQRIQSASQKMAGLIDDLLYLSKISREDVRRAPLDLSQLVHEAVAHLGPTEPARSISFKIEENITAIGDARLLRLALSHLFSNAVKFTRHCAEANIEFGQTTRANENIYFIRDNGIGFDMAFANKLFKPFQRLHTTQEFEGSGIGLSLVARIIERHGGKIWAESTPDHGASFFFTLTTRSDLTLN